MAPAQPKNAIERRLDLLADDWNEFAENPAARLSRWLVDSDTLTMLDAFLQVQQEEVGDIPDLFVRFDEPFADPQGYGLQLRESLQRQYDEIRDAIAEDEIAADWQPPEIPPGSTDVESFVHCCASFRAYYEGLMNHLAVALLPQSISDVESWKKWLAALLAGDLPNNVRFLVIDADENPALDDLAAGEPNRLVTIKPELNMPAAYMELARGSGPKLEGAGPGLAFRTRFVALTNAATSSNLAAAERAAEQAMEIAVAQNWPQLQVAVSMALAAAYMAGGQAQRALANYRKGAASVEQSDDPAAPKLLIQSRFGEASVLVGEGQYAEAATVYEQTAPLAEKQQDHFATLESWRMAAYCHEMCEQYDPAWQSGHKALDVAEQLDEETRDSSTLPYVAQGLLRLLEREEYADQTDGLHGRFQELLGADWPDKLPEGAPAS